MKRIIALLVLISIGTTSCKQEKKETKTDTPTQVEATEKFVIKPEATSVKWTAYKTTEKKGVGGEFSVLKFENKAGATPQEALNNLSFSIPVSSLFTKDESRDAKLKEFFFGAMLDTEFLKGTIKYVNDACVASITMNGVTNDLPLEVHITDARRVNMTGTMNLKDWNALDALESINKACFDLHKGPDGVSKTWEDVAIEINTFLREN
ncbi:YceI family protein [Flavivirga rizhaonensis]|uniref:YceI family protein n=1 Tax=Flavivirga rizhaonensis TaxID=2559571 RepID=A0A4S1DT74_9FLAO|nr:YceI family protein [Flavivirga rizhaonensis]TGV00598.1 YceI family protein [Flavivirga rizhaonensis]